MEIQLPYGDGAKLVCRVAADRLWGHLTGPTSLEDPRAAFAAAVDQPLDFPPLMEMVVSGDRVVIALDRLVPAAPVLLDVLLERLVARGVEPEQVLVLQPAQLTEGGAVDPRPSMSHPAARQIDYRVHDASAADAVGYLASSSGGHRILLSRLLLDADLVIPVGRARLDPVLGYHGAADVFFPGMSDPSSFQKCLGAGHQELRPEDDRPLRQLIEETGWLTGYSLSIEVAAAAGGMSPAKVVAGQPESVRRSMRQWLSVRRVSLQERPELVVVTLGEGPAWWSRLATAIQMAARIVARDGRIVVASNFQAPSPNVAVLRGCRSAEEALTYLKEDHGPEAAPCLQILKSTLWAEVFLLSRLEPAIVEDLFCQVVDHPEEIQRLLSQAASVALIVDGDEVFTEVKPEPVETRMREPR